MPKAYQICQRCIMDTTDPEITFDAHGYCNHCRRVETLIMPQWSPDAKGAEALRKTVETIKQATRGKQYNCIIGLSGGVDSSYLAYIVKKEFGLNPLAVHVDGGWNSDIAVSNIEKLTKKLDIDLYTIVINWEEMKDVQLAFLKAQVPNQDIPQDHAFFAGLYNYATLYDIRYVLSGSNYATESILPSSWGYNAMDAKYLRGIHKKYGQRSLKTFPVVSLYKSRIYYPSIKKMQVVRPLNYMPYSKDAAIALLEKELGWTYYGGKHHESRFTKFFQSYYLPVKFGYDKRRAHLSSQIMAQEITRDSALQTMQKPPYDENTIENDKTFIAKKLGITREELNRIMNQPNKNHKYYASNDSLLKVCRRLISLQRQIKTMVMQ